MHSASIDSPFVDQHSYVTACSWVNQSCLVWQMFDEGAAFDHKLEGARHLLTEFESATDGAFSAIVMGVSNLLQVTCLLLATSGYGTQGACAGLGVVPLTNCSVQLCYVSRQLLLRPSQQAGAL
jgi:hypothetical protein